MWRHARLCLFNVRSARERLAEEKTLAALVDPDARELAADGLHFNTTGQVTLGLAMARKWLKMDEASGSGRGGAVTGA